ncbi:Cof-type HAD-IIB family hydrolase [Tuberibacillus sp. Marseille-P3662]|uniref:Cof-type HAD-IIB family hydrolase n=1 Tax=Tuberibacillus sp. Marseille-P3662 TaxID=1965358 RepID=UPI000A1CD9A6|nr:Cof-type HAD-IIB family hydrolase [Tuberibacillus sp. Marseille-P3662]
MSEQPIVFFDIDGTLLDEDKNIPDTTRQAVYDLQKKGVITAIATGRAPFMFADVRRELNIDSFISFNGQYVVHKGEAVFKNPMHFEDLGELHQKAMGGDYPLAFLSSHKAAVTHDQHPFIMKSFNSLKLDPPDYDKTFHHDHEIYQALIFCEEGEDIGAFQAIDAFDYVRWHRYSMDVVPTGGSKAIGIQSLLDNLGIDRRNTIAFGDAMNDIEMLSFVENGVAMGNGQPQVKDVAKHVTTHVSDNGIYNGLKHLGLL